MNPNASASANIKPQTPTTPLQSGSVLKSNGNVNVQANVPAPRGSSSTSGTSPAQGFEDLYDTVEDSLKTKLFQQFDKIQKHLHWAGFPGNYGTLSSLQTNKGRRFKRVNDHGLHLVWKNDIQYIKPLPSCFGQTVPEFSNLKPCLRGLFHSYVQLIATEFDFELAIEECLLPKSFRDEKGWELWQSYTAAYNTCINLEKTAQAGGSPAKTHHRYHYGSLRLRRLNAIMWVVRPGGRSHFHQIEDPLFNFWRTYGSYVALIFVYLSLGLTAMQVVLAAGSQPDWVISSFKYSSWAIIVLIVAQVPLFAIVSLLWIFTTTALSPRFLSVLFSDKKRP